MYDSSPPLLHCIAAGRRWLDPFASRPAVEALRAIDLTVRVGDLVLVEGPAGAGKSTLLLLAAGAVAPTSGRVLWAGRADAAAVRPHRMRGRPWEYGALTVREALRHHAAELARREPGWSPPTRFVPLLRRVGLRGVARERLGDLAPLDAFRVVVAQARLSRPGLLCVDDALATLPPTEVLEALALLRAVADEGAAVLIAAREIGFGLEARVGLRRVRLEGGRIVPAATGVRRHLELDVVAATPTQWRRLTAALPSMRADGRRWRVPLEGRSPEQVLARCREADVPVRGSQVVERPG